jgi:hypothetical protein
MHPIYGSGMTVTGDETIKGSRCTDWGDRYGYCYQPQHYQVASSGMATASSFSTYGIAPDQVISPHDRHPCGHHPYCSTVEEAVQWLRDRGLAGQVMRYAHHKPVSERVPTWEWCPIERGHVWKQYAPYLTAGVVAAVTTPEEPETIRIQLLNYLRGGFDVHKPDGTVQHLGNI